MFLLSGCFENYELFISLIFQLFFSGCGELRITENTDTESADKESHYILYIYIYPNLCQ
jgi:hypothetical protein